MLDPNFLRLPVNQSLPGNDLLAQSLGLTGLGIGAQNPIGLMGLTAPNLGLPMMGNFGLSLNPPNMGLRSNPNTFPLGSSQHAQAFYMKGPPNEIKLFVGGLAFQTAGMYWFKLNNT